MGEKKNLPDPPHITFHCNNILSSPFSCCHYLTTYYINIALFYRLVKTEIPKVDHYHDV